jgi:hypothetical protein
VTNSGTSTSEGLISLSVDGAYMSLSTDTTPRSAPRALQLLLPLAINRVVGLVDASGAINTSTALTDAQSGGNPRSVATTNGTDIWVSGSAGGGALHDGWLHDLHAVGGYTD